MWIIAGFAFSNGNWRRLVYGVDSFGNLCGVANTERIPSGNSGLDLTDYDYLYYTNPADKNGLKICVKACPVVGTTALYCNISASTCVSEQPEVCMGQSGNAYHIIDNAVTGYYNTSSGDRGVNGTGCPSVIYTSTDIPGLRRCVPGDTTYAEELYSNMDTETFQEIFSDFYNSAKIILYSALIACAISLAVIFLMRCCAAVLIYTMVLAAQGALIALCVFLIVQWQKLKNNRTELDAESKNEKVFKGLAIAAIIITVVVFLILVAMRNRIRLTVAVFEEASKCMARMPQISFSPIFCYLTLGGFFAYWIFVYLFLASAKSISLDSGTGHAVYTVSDSYTKMWWYHLFGLFWTSQFILACQEIVLAGAVATWYFTREKSSISSPFTSSIYRLVRYHIGSAAFGSLIIAIIQMARFILGYIQRKLRGKTSKIVEFILCCLQCCLWCFEKFMKFINKNAYIEIAVYGYSFCRAAMTAFILLAKNILRVIAINTIGAFTLFMCKILIVCVTCAIALGMLRVSCCVMCCV